MMAWLKITATLVAISGLLLSCNTTTNQPSNSPPSVPIAQTQLSSISRVVALSSLSADIIHKLNKTKLIGIPGSSLLRQNPELAKLPQVSEGQTPPNLEKIVALKPDLVIGSSGFHDQVLTRLKAMGIRTVTTQVTSWKSLQEVTQMLATEIQADLTPLLQSYQSCQPTQPVQAGSTLILVSNQPILAPNKTSWAGDLLSQFQIPNLVADLQGNAPQRGYVTLSPEKILEANPETLILVDVGDGTIDKLRKATFWNQLTAVAKNRVYVFDYYGLVNPGSLDAIIKTCQQLRELSTRPVSQRET